MKYFTPDLFIAFNSNLPKIAKGATIHWDQAVQEYDRHLKAIRRKLPPTLRKLSKLYLHDAELLGFGEDSPSPNNRVVHSAAWQQDQVFVILYFLIEEPVVTPPIAHVVFSQRSVHWLYDEVDVRGHDDFRHEICFSDGTTYRFRFQQLAVLTIESSAELAEGAAYANGTAGR